MKKAFELINTVKTYRNFQLGPVNLDLEKGTVLGFVGPNGSGKSTTMHCITGLVKAQSGEINIFGKPNNPSDTDWKQEIGYVGDTHVFYENWTGERNLNLLSKFYKNWSEKNVQNLSKKLEVPLDKKAKELSKGNRMKLALITALAHTPKLLLLDEPTSGLDPVVRDEVLDILFDLVADGNCSIFYSTHILSDISRLADDLAFLIDGKVLLKSSKDDLTETWRKISFRLDYKGSRFNSSVNWEQDGNDHRVISSDFERTLLHLGELGAENIQENRMSIDEIAVHILRGGKNVDAV